MASIVGTNPAKNERLYLDVLTNIRQGHLQPGHRLPAESELAERYSVSRGTVRQSLARLEAQGLLVKKRGSGTYVNDQEGHSGPDKAKMSVCVRTSAHCLVGPGIGSGGAWELMIRQGLDRSAALHNLGVYYQMVGSSRLNAKRDVPASKDLVGVIGIAVGLIDEEILFKGLPDIPKVMINGKSRDLGIPSVDIDQEGGAFAATSFLLRIGHRRISLCFGEPWDSTLALRESGFRRAFKQAGVGIDQKYIMTDPIADYYTRWPEQLRKILKMRPLPTALLMNNLSRSVHLFDVLRSEGIRVPEDISIILFDDSIELGNIAPSVSCVSQPVRDMAAMSVDIFAEMVAGHHVEQHHRRLKAELIMRESVSLPRQDHP